jgi:hypothetical protein
LRDALFAGKSWTKLAGGRTKWVEFTPIDESLLVREV